MHRRELRTETATDAGQKITHSATGGWQCLHLMLGSFIYAHANWSSAQLSARGFLGPPCRPISVPAPSKLFANLIACSRSQEITHTFMYFRVLWVIVFLVASSLFCYMTAAKIQQLVSKDKKVDINVDYPNQLRFPAVTVCNQNKFRWIMN